jgi:hypothetical protein
LPTLRIVIHSKWIEWLVQESAGVLRGDSLMHFAIHSPEDCIDVVTEFSPEVRWLNLPRHVPRSAT